MTAQPAPPDGDPLEMCGCGHKLSTHRPTPHGLSCWICPVIADRDDCLDFHPATATFLRIIRPDRSDR